MHEVEGAEGGSSRPASGVTSAPIVCFSHLGWYFVFQRPHHLMSRAARTRPVFFWEEPLYEERDGGALEVSRSPEGVTVIRPLLPSTSVGPGAVALQRQLLDGFVAEHGLDRPVLWYYTPGALAFSAHLSHAAVVYDCMDELSAFSGADPALPLQERALLRHADVVFAGGYSLYEAKRGQHPAVYPMPSGVDVGHFHRARGGLAEPSDLSPIPRPRLGYCGVIDERLDYALLGQLADARPDWQVVLLGPLMKVDPAALPQRPNIHYLGAKPYGELPAYLAGWDVALMPFACNEATRFISPTKTPEYLAAGRPVVSTPIADVVRHYGRMRAVGIADDPASFVRAVEAALTLARTPGTWLAEADAFLAGASWNGIWARMDALVRQHAGEHPRHPRARPGGFTRAYDALVVGAGFAGSVLAERLAANGSRVLLVDRRDHVGGNAFDHEDDAGLLVHRYGPHIFHTNAEAIVRYLSRFTAWRPYEHRVRARVGDRLLPVPINRTTINSFFGVNLAERDVPAFLATKAVAVPVVRSAADVVLATVGRELYEALFRDYTRKQWGCDPSRLDKSVTARVPTRTTDDDRYFTDSFQAMPRDGFARMFENMLDHPNITRLLCADYRDVQREFAWDHLVYTGPIDEYFGHRFGVLPYRSLRFEHRTLPEEWHQPVGVVNYPSADLPYTRVTEFKHITGQSHPQTSICYEYPSENGDPYYPVPCEESAALYARYQALADATPAVTFVGRLATYRYYNMDQVVGQALATFNRLAARGLAPAVARQPKGSVAPMDAGEVSAG